MIHAGELLPEEVTRRLTGADIFCMASFSEGLPISIMEAMAVGSARRHNLDQWYSELAIQEVTAVTVPPANSAALAAGIKRLIADQAATRTVGQRGPGRRGAHALARAQRGSTR